MPHAYIGVFLPFSIVVYETTFWKLLPFTFHGVEKTDFV